MDSSDWVHCLSNYKIEKYVSNESITHMRNSYPTQGAKYAKHYYPRRMSHRAELGITVLMSEWGKGLGNRLMETVIEYAKNSGIEIIELAVRSDNERAIRLYKKHGFESVGVYKSYFKIDEKYADFKLMNLYLI